MKTSILIIAHNEEAYIQDCIESVLVQSKKANEIILVAHNCTDKTIKKAKKYWDVEIFELRTETSGPTIARKHGFEKVKGDIIACIDGDTVASQDWFEKLTLPFQSENVVATGGKVFFYKNFWGNIASFFFFLQWLPLISKIFPFYFWWANFACRKEAYEKVWWLERVQEIQKKLNLYYDAEDCTLSLLLRDSGKIVYVSDAKTYSYPHSSFDNTDRGARQRADFKKIYTYFKQK